MEIYIYTDGSARNNGYENSSGGCSAVVLQAPDFCRSDAEMKIIDIFQQRSAPTTNNREEMKPIIWALENYGKHPLCTPLVYSDSRYAVNTFNIWMWNWRENGWVRSGNKPVENLDLVKEYDKLSRQGYKIQLEKVRGHAGNKWNELADALATGRITKEEIMLKYGKN